LVGEEARCTAVRFPLLSIMRQTPLEGNEGQERKKSMQQQKPHDQTSHHEIVLYDHQVLIIH